MDSALMQAMDWWLYEGLVLVIACLGNITLDTHQLLIMTIWYVPSKHPSHSFY